MESWFIPALVAIVALAAVLVLLIALVAVVGFVFRRSKADPGADRAESLATLDYDNTGEGRWTRSMQGTKMVFEERAEGLRWHVQLPRYNTMTLQLAELSSGRSVDEPFEAGISTIDGRFVLGSPQPDRIVALLGEQKLQKALLRVPNLALVLSADEVTLEDPDGAGVKSLGNLGAIEAELAVHAMMINLVNVLFASLYSETGTVLDQYR